MKPLIWSVLILGAIIALPLLLRRKDAQPLTAKRQLVVITANNEALRHETELAFREYHRRHHDGEEVTIDWRTPGGTSEIVRFLKSTFAANAAHAWQRQGRAEEYPAAKMESLLDARCPVDADSSAAWRWFRESAVGIDVDVMLGGGQYDHEGLRRAGLLVSSGIRQRHPEWFAEGADGVGTILSAGGGGETWYDAEGDSYYAVCFSTFGIVYNRDRLAQAGFTPEEIEHFGERWSDLADPRLYGAVGLADPSQSGSITKCFEMLIQREMQDTIARFHPGEAVAEIVPSPEELEAAWTAAMTLLKRLGGNAAYLTFSAGKVPVDAALGQIAAGMCIDFYGRSEVEWQKSQTGRESISYRTPTAASTVSADPVGILRGAPNRELAEEFVDFLLSPEAQRLWGKAAGAPGGPRDYTLYRLPVRRDMYEGSALSDTVFGNERPLDLAQQFHYRADWTAHLFTAIRVLTKTMIIDCGPELRAVCGEILRRPGGWSALTAAERSRLEALPFSYREARGATKTLDDPRKQAELRRGWIEFFREHYRL